MNDGLQVDALVTGYTHAPILRGVSLTVDVGEIVGLLGANGAGKTTLLRAIAGTVPVWEGDISFAGSMLTKATPWRRVRSGVVHVPEGRHVFTTMTVAENLDVAGLVAPDRDAAREEVYSLFPRLAERRQQRAGSMSGGEQQMLAIGRALMTRPKILLVDEMSAGLAPVVTTELLDGLRAVHRQGVGVLLVEQSPHLIADVVDRLYLIEQGTIVGSGTFEVVGGADAIAALYLGVR